MTDCGENPTTSTRGSMFPSSFGASCVLLTPDKWTSQTLVRGPSKRKTSPPKKWFYYPEVDSMRWVSHARKVRLGPVAQVFVVFEGKNGLRLDTTYQMARATGPWRGYSLVRPKTTVNRSDSCNFARYVQSTRRNCCKFGRLRTVSPRTKA